MKTKTILPAVIAALLAVAPALHAAPNTYQVTGPVISVTDTMIVVQKGKEQWQIARTPDTKVTGDLKVGEKVTVQYTMTATGIEVKPSKAK